MRITIVASAFIPLPPAGCGAVERVWDGLAHEFGRRGHEVTFLCRAHPSQQGDEVLDGVRFIRRTQFRQTGWRAINMAKGIAYASRMISLLPESDILVLNDVATALMAPRLRPRAECIVLNLQRIPKRLLGRLLFSHADRLVAVSSAVRDVIADLFPHLLARLAIIGNPIHTDHFKPAVVPHEPNGPRAILYTGRIHPEKGLHLLVEAFREVYSRRQGLCLRVVGPWRQDQGGGGIKYLNCLRAAAAGLPVSFEEPITDARRLAALLQSVHYYCYPSLAEKGETFGVAALEACATGIPTLVSDLACFREFIRDGETGFVFDHRASDPAACLADSLERMMTMPQNSMSAVCRSAGSAAHAFSYPHIAEAYLALFAELLEARRPSQAVESKAA